MFVEYSTNRRKKERKSVERRERNTGRTGRDAEGITHDTTGKRTDERERRVNGGRRSGKVARAGRKRRSDCARRIGKTVRTRRKRRAGSARRDGKPG